MLPTMYHSGLLVATLFTLALGGDLDAQKGKTPSDSGVLATPAPTDEPLRMSEFCFFGKFPSASCRFKCHLQNQDAYCDEEQNKCLCSAPEEEEDSQDVFNAPNPLQGLFDTPSHGQDSSHQQDSGAQANPPHFAIPMHPATQQPDSESQDQTGENKQHVVFYIFDLNKIFGRKNQSENSPEGPTTTDNATQTESAESKTEGVAPAGWAFQHLMALLIIVLLSVLIVLELYACYRKQSSKNHMESIFKTIPVPNKA